MIIIIALRVLSGDPTGYGAATSRFFTIYENFSGKIVSVLLEYNFLFFLILHP
ncbi:putative phage protein [Escherichia coli 042]|uniref:Phage protein n=1 Tax=Escherichia coli O44:H18 (strain 042 / EAEC) TaxID=216592 RepID=D3H3D3_ECO44|nr:putative phage protein [Escherichia coli 042]